MKKRKILVKLKDVNDNYLLTLTNEDLKSKIYYSENINWPQGELTLTINNKFEELPVFIAEVYVVTDANPLWRKVYSGLVNKQTIVRTEYDEIRLSFVWIGTVLSSYIYSKFTDSTWRDLEFTQDLDVENYVDNILNNLKTSEWETIVNSWTPQIGEVFTWWTSWATATLVAYETGWDFRSWFLQIDWEFEQYEILTWGTSGATIEVVNNNYLDIYKNLLSKWAITSNSTTYSREYVYEDQLTVLKEIVKQNDNLYFFIDQDWKLDFKEKPTTALVQNTLFWNKDVLSVEKNLDSDLINKVYVKYSSWVVESKDITSITNNWLHEKYIVENTINDQTSAFQRADSIVQENKEPKGELKIKINADYDYFLWGLTWWEMVNTWWDYNQTWWELSNFKSVYDFHPGDMINIRNFDEEKQLSNLLIVRKEFYEDYVILYCDKYKNYTETILNNK